jgi:hypothetical protein
VNQDPNYLYFDKRHFDVMMPKQKDDEYRSKTSGAWERVVDECGGFLDPQYRRLRSLCALAQIEAVEGKKEQLNETFYSKLLKSEPPIPPSIGGNFGEEKLREEFGEFLNCPAGFQGDEREEDHAWNAFQAAAIPRDARIVELERELSKVNGWREDLRSKLHKKTDQFNAVQQTLVSALGTIGELKSKYETERTLLEHANFKVKELEKEINSLRQKLAQKAVMMRAEFDQELQESESIWKLNAAAAVQSVLECRDLLDPNGNLSLKDAASALQLRNQQLEAQLADSKLPPVEAVQLAYAETKIQQLEADAAAMRKALESGQRIQFEGTPHVSVCVDDIDHALSPAAGKALLAKMERMEKALKEIENANPGPEMILTFTQKLQLIARLALSEFSEGREK